MHVDGRLRTLPGSYSGFYENVCDAMAGRAALAVTPEHAIETIRAIELARESAGRGGTRIAY
jgi:predicted dehydrogenase